MKYSSFHFVESFARRSKLTEFVVCNLLCWWKRKKDCRYIGIIQYWKDRVFVRWFLGVVGLSCWRAMPMIEIQEIELRFEVSAIKIQALSGIWTFSNQSSIFKCNLNFFKFRFIFFANFELKIGARYETTAILPRLRSCALNPLNKFNSFKYLTNSF